MQAERAIERMAAEGIDAVPRLAVSRDTALDAIESVDFELNQRAARRRDRGYDLAGPVWC